MKWIWLFIPWLFASSVFANPGIFMLAMNSGASTNYYQYGFEDGLTTGMLGSAVNVATGGNTGRYSVTDTSQTPTTYADIYDRTMDVAAGAGEVYVYPADPNAVESLTVNVYQNTSLIGTSTLSGGAWQKINFNTTAATGVHIRISASVYLWDDGVDSGYTNYTGVDDIKIRIP